MWIHVLLVAAGGAAGARGAIPGRKGQCLLPGHGVPYGTLFVNVAGSFLPGFRPVWRWAGLPRPTQCDSTSFPLVPPPSACTQACARTCTRGYMAAVWSQTASLNPTTCAALCDLQTLTT